jgi:PAS domain S-box-containing protein
MDDSGNTTESHASPPPSGAATTRLRLATPRTRPPPRTAHSSPAYEQLLQGLYDAVLISDLDGRIIDGNRRAMDFLQLSAGELTDSHVTTLISGLNREVLEQVRKHLAAGRFTLLDATCVRKDGTTFPAEIAISRIDLTATGNLVFSVRNIERRKRTQERLRTEHNALQNSANAVAITGPEGGIKYVNPAFLALWGCEELESVVGRNIREMWHDGEETPELVRKPLAGETWIGVIGMRRYDGRQMYLQATAAPNRDGDRKLLGMVFSFIDVTEKHKAEEAIRKEAEVQISRVKQKKDFAGSLNILDITDLMQLIEAIGKSGLLSVSDAEEQTVGEAAFDAGRIVTANCGGLTGEPAVYEILRRGGTSFHFHEGPAADRDPSILKTVTQLLLEGMRSIDESESQI